MYQESPRTSDLEIHFLKEYNSFRDTCKISVSVRIRFGCGCWETKTDLEERFLSLPAMQVPVQTSGSVEAAPEVWRGTCIADLSSFRLQCVALVIKATSWSDVPAGL